MEGLVERVPHTGSYVRELCLEDIQDIYVIKRELEAVAVRLATSRLGPEDIAEGERLLAEEMELWKRGKVTCAELEQCVSFHEWIQEKSGNERLAALMRQLDDQALRMRMTLARVEGWLDTSAKDHEHVLEAMARGDGEEAAEFIKVHNDHILDEVKRLRTMGLVDLPERG
jgi:DNA-binding GntR family transcriptional regulator